LFLAVDLPRPVRDALDEALGPMRAALPGARWVPSENWHLTVKFLGWTWPRLVPTVPKAARPAAASHAPASLSLERMGAFPTMGRARVLWVGLSDPTGTLVSVASELDAAMARDFRPEDRGFTPHLTVARFKPVADLDGALPEVVLPEDIFRVDRLVLYRSHLQRPAPVYEPLEEFPFGA
jgi:2'-5' RNA ligase